MCIINICRKTITYIFYKYVNKSTYTIQNPGQVINIISNQICQEALLAIILYVTMTYPLHLIKITHIRGTTVELFIFENYEYVADRLLTIRLDLL